jgi:C4-dicarboxylate transporter, DctQ subunit
MQQPDATPRPAWLHALNRLEEGTLAVTLLGLSVLAFVQVVARYLFGVSFTWFEELSRYLGVFMTFLGAGLGVKYGLHFSMDFMVERVPPKAARVMRLVSALIAVALFLTLAWLGGQHCAKLMHFNALSPAMKIPMFWAYLPIPFFSLVMAARFGLRAWREVRPAPTKEARP